MYAVKMLNDDSVLIPDVKMKYNLIVQIRIVKDWIYCFISHNRII